MLFVEQPATTVMITANANDPRLTGALVRVGTGVATDGHPGAETSTRFWSTAMAEPVDKATAAQYSRGRPVARAPWVHRRQPDLRPPTHNEPTDLRIAHMSGAGRCLRRSLPATPARRPTLSGRRRCGRVQPRPCGRSLGPSSGSALRDGLAPGDVDDAEHGVGFGVVDGAATHDQFRTRWAYCSPARICTAASGRRAVPGTPACSTLNSRTLQARLSAAAGPTAGQH